MKSTRQPFVSVIVPVYNDAGRIGRCIEALLAQTYPADCHEILIVDNGSTDQTRAVIQRYPVQLLVEDRAQSSYAARNTGLAHARGEVIAFTDSDCTPVPRWIEEGVRTLLDEDADIVGGNVRFTFSSRRTGAEIYDSLANLQVEKAIRDRGMAQTANLFVRAALFERLGPFPQHVQSGGDVTWTSNASSHGAKLVFSPRAEVAHPTRSFRELLKKQYRVGKGKEMLMPRAGASTRAGSGGAAGGRSDTLGILGTAYAIVRGFFPVPMRWINRNLQLHQISVSRLKRWEVWFAGWLGAIATNLGRVSVTLRPKVGRPR